MSRHTDPDLSIRGRSSFARRLKELGRVLRRGPVEIVQVNLGRYCNLHCVHCHVEAGPHKIKENMNAGTLAAVLRFIDTCPAAHTLDITGGAPELNPHFKRLVKEGRKRGLKVIDRCNLTVLFESGQDDLAEFLAQHHVEIVASLPCYEPENVDKQRGRGTFDRSIQALKKLNALGYGREGTGLILDLVYNPVGPHLPPAQERLEADYKRRLKGAFGIVFNRLFTITNMPITRYAKYLKALNRLDDYRRLLHDHFNETTLDRLMCLNTISIGWDGRLFDCDFNQALDWAMGSDPVQTVFNTTGDDLVGALVRVGDHCYGCTAGCGSSCQGALQSV